MTGYHNSTHAVGAELAQAEAEAQSQQDTVLAIFRFQPLREMSPFQVWVEYDHPLVPLTSIRRAISNLTKDGYLVRTASQRVGPYRRKEYLWRLAAVQPTIGRLA